MRRVLQKNSLKKIQEKIQRAIGAIRQTEKKGEQKKTKNLETPTITLPSAIHMIINIKSKRYKTKEIKKLQQINGENLAEETR